MLRPLALTLAALFVLASSAWLQAAPRERRFAPTQPREESAPVGEVQAAAEDDTSTPADTPTAARAARVARTIPEAGIRNGVGKRVYVFRIDTDQSVSDMIDRSWQFRLHRALVAAETAGADAFILEINTNGGALDAAFMMQARVLDAKVPVIAYINNKAISAGAIVAMAADIIVMRPTAKIGDALPVTPDPTAEFGMKAANRKVVSVVAAEMRSAAEANGHPVDVAVAMVDPEKPLPGFTKRGDLLTLTTTDAVRAGLTDWVAEDLNEVLRLADLEGADIVVPTLRPLENIAGFLSRSVIVSFLFTVGFVCGLIEMKTPGIGLPGAIAVVCFGLAFFGTSLADLSGFLEPLLLIVGIGLLALEIFVIPGFGVPGIAGICCVVAAIGLSTTGIPLSAAGLTEYWLAPMVYSVLGSMVGTAVLFPVVLKVLPYIPYLNQAILDPRVDGAHGGSMLDAEPDSLAAVVPLGAVGVAATDLRPAGVATFQGTRFDVMTDGRYVERGTTVVVLERNGSRIVVAPQA